MIVNDPAYGAPESLAAVSVQTSIATSRGKRCPSSSMTAGIAFGPLWGTILTLIGATIGATVAFSVARYLGRETVARLLKGRLKDLDDKIEVHGIQVIFFLRSE